MRDEMRQTSKLYNPGRFVVNVIISYLQTMFAKNADSIGIGFSLNDQESDLLIYDSQSTQTTTIGSRPVIGVTRGPWRYTDANPNRMFSFNQKNGVITCTDLIMVPIYIQVMSRNGLEAERLASIVANFLELDKRALTTLGIHSINNIEVGREQAVAEIPEAVMVPVTCVCYIQVFWQMIRIPEQELLEIRKNITVNGEEI